VKQSRKSEPALAWLAVKLADELAELSGLFKKQGLSLNDRQCQQLLSFVDLLLRWNQTHNLVSRADEQSIVSRHIRESLGLVLACSPRPEARVIDIGSGGGFPAVPMKIFRPDLQMNIFEANGKKAAFLKTVAVNLNLAHFAVHYSRIETARLPESSLASLITARAVAELSVLWQWAEKLLAPRGTLWAIKGGELEKELSSLPEAGRISAIEVASFPEWLGIEKSRFMVRVKKI
jgi:16S rRNA (guanine527-N7)-methyltransferase